MKIQNKNKTVTAIMTSLMIGLVMLSPTTIIPNVNALTDGPEPNEVAEWRASHPNFFGCVHTDLKTHISKEVTCLHPELKPSGSPHGNSKLSPSGDFTYTVSNLDCQNSSYNDNCWVGGEFSDNGPYNQILANTQIGSVPSNIPTKFGYWAGLTNCYFGHCPTADLLVQSGWQYTTGGGTTPQMFTEIVGHFSYNGVNCFTGYCGTVDNKHTHDNLYTSNYGRSGSWVAYVQDNSDSTSNFIMVPFSTAGVSNSVPYAITSMEATNVPNKTFFPASPVSLTSVTLYAYGVGQVSTNTNLMASYVGPTTGSISVTYTATGTPTATITNSY